MQEQRNLLVVLPPIFLKLFWIKIIKIKTSIGQIIWLYKKWREKRKKEEKDNKLVGKKFRDERKK